DTAATIKRDISASIDAPITEGKNISAKPTSKDSEASAAKGTCITSSKGTNGAPSQANTGVYYAIIKAINPKPITIGATPIHISKTFCIPSLKNLYKLFSF